MWSAANGLAGGSSETHVIIAVAQKASTGGSQSMKPRSPSASTGVDRYRDDAAAPPCVGRGDLANIVPPAWNSLSIRSRGKKVEKEPITPAPTFETWHAK